MAGEWTFGRKLGLSFAITAIAFVFVAVVGLRSTQRLIDNDALVKHTHGVRVSIAQLGTQLLDAESSARGYVVAGTERFLAPYHVARKSVQSTFEVLRVMTADNPVQQRALTELRPVLDGRLGELEAVVEARRSVGFEAGAARIITEHGQELAERIRVALLAMDDEELRLLKQREALAESSATKATSVIVWGGVAAVIVTMLLGWQLGRTLIRRIGAAVVHVQTSSTELQTAANQQVAAAREQSTAMTEIATTMTELLASSRQISDGASRVSQIATQTGAAARDGEAIVARGNDATTQVRHQVDLIVAHMLELGKKSQQAGVVLDIVAELAEQTNILAINAAIEAAGAGDGGRRFGVVADEIRKLADRVTESTKTIRTILDDVRGAVSVTVMATETGSKAVEAGAVQVAAMARAFRDITALVSTTAESTREIELSTKQQASAVEQVNLAVSSVTQATRETEVGATQTLQTSSQLTTLSTALNRLVQRTA